MTDTYQAVIEDMHRVAPHPITEAEANEAARNLIAFGQLAVRIRQRQMRECNSAN